MSDLSATWHAEHANFARLLDLLERQVAAFQAGEQPNYDLMLDIIHYLRNYPDRVHHPQENVAFARLLERDSTLKPQIDRLLQEHRVIAAAGSKLLEHLDAVVAGALEPRSIVEAAAATYLTYFRQHMATEDKEVIPRAVQLLTAQDWAAVAAAVPAGPDPLLGDDIEARYRTLRRQIAFDSQSG
ncbi:MAG: hemerythrin domain-containing protein [Betaproteobacteria bacterium]|nr:hemerythrin domain-containing protein [Betaproteobacteria bacterium]